MIRGGPGCGTIRRAHLGKCFTQAISCYNPMLTYILVIFAALSAGMFAGGRMMLARQRWGEVRMMLTRHKNTESLEQAFVATLEQRRQFERANLVHHVRVVNAIQFVIIWNWDLTTLLSLLDQSREAWSQGWNRKLHARVLALTIFESVIKMKPLLDKENSRKTSLRRSLRALNLESSFGDELDRLHAELTAIFSQHDSLLEGIRDHTIGHRHLDVPDQMDWVRKADVNELEKLGVQLLRWTTELIRCFTRISQALPRDKVTNESG